MEMTMSKNQWIAIQARIFNSDDGRDWYRQGRLPRILRNIGDVTLVDLEFESQEDQVWFSLKWL
jgi:hypothetical protein